MGPEGVGGLLGPQPPFLLLSALWDLVWGSTEQQGARLGEVGKPWPPWTAGPLLWGRMHQAVLPGQAEGGDGKMAHW